MKAIIKETGQEVEVVSRFMPKKRNAPGRSWVCILNDERIVDEDSLEYIEQKPQVEICPHSIKSKSYKGNGYPTPSNEDAYKAAEKYAAEQTPVEYPNLYGEDAIKSAYAAGMLAERERLMKEAPVADVIEMRGSTGPFADYPFMLSLGFRKIPNIEYHGGKVRVIIEEIK